MAATTLVHEVSRSGLRPISERMRRNPGLLSVREATEAALTTLMLAQLHDAFWKMLQRRLAKGIERQELDQIVADSLVVVELTATVIAQLDNVPTAGRYSEQETQELTEAIAAAARLNGGVRQAILSLAEQLNRFPPRREAAEVLAKINNLQESYVDGDELLAKLERGEKL